MRARTSKKEPQSRESEVRKFASEALITWVQENGAILVREPSGTLVVVDVMLFAEGGTSLSIFDVQGLIHTPNDVSLCR